MSSETEHQPPTPDEGMKDDELSRRFYMAGCFGLPWLWIVHALHFYGKQRHLEAQRILREEQQNGEASPELEADGETAEKERMWVMRGRNSAIFVSAAFLAWVIFVQYIFPDALPSSWYILGDDSYEATGW